MCREESFLVTKDKVLYRWELTSHSDLFDFYGLRDNGRDAIPCEIYPDDPADWDKPEKWTLHVDCDIRPDWLDEARKGDAADEMRAIVSPYILRQDTKIITSGAWIIAAGEVDKVIAARIISVTGGTLNAFRGGTLNAFWGGTLNDFRGGTLNAFRGGTLNAFWGGTLNDFWGGTLNAFRGGTLNDFWGGTIKVVHPDAKILKARRNYAKIEKDLRSDADKAITQWYD